ncbi:MAG: DUF5682 family protein [Bacteroidota bacterium]
MEKHILGVRHHGPGSARQVRAALEALQPDVVLIEGPPDANGLIALAGKAGMQPPVAILAYEEANPQHAAFYPFAEFSPEWQAILYGHKTNVVTRFMDLPLMHKMALDLQPEESPEPIKATTSDQELEVTYDNPMLYLAEAAGYADSESWWERTFERSTHTDTHFEAVSEAVAALRSDLPDKRPQDLLREAYMRKVIRQAEKEGFAKAVIICGAWHTSALTNMPSQKEDNALLKGLPKCKVNSTWIPWTYSRLTFKSGYGAGVLSPGWYHHLWENQENIAESWITKVAREFREEGMDTSVSHVIEAVRLAEMLAALREHPQPGLEELNEAVQTVLCFGEPQMMTLIQKELIVSNRIGAVPEEAPSVPLQQDLQKWQKKLRMPPKDEEKRYVLDLRKENDLERSKLLHRLNLLNIKWGQQEHSSGTGTFKEQWLLHWQPEMMISIVEMGIWGNTVQSASSAFVISQLESTEALGAVAQLLNEAIPADIPEAIDRLMHKIDDLAAVSGDVMELMRSIPPLARVSRYGNVRKTDLELLAQVVEGLVVRVCIGITNACMSLDADASEAMHELIIEVNGSIQLVDNQALKEHWIGALIQLSENHQVNGLIAGRATRILSDAHAIDPESIANKFSYALSTANEPDYSAAWLEGFLKGSATILLLDDSLWFILQNWVEQLDDETFKQLLPLLRRNFSTFSQPERRKIGERAKRGQDQIPTKTRNDETGINAERGEAALAVLAQLFGLSKE